MNEDKLALQEFSGTARLFPLPNVVLLPHSMQPLHIFEPRYRQMTADALASDRLIAMVLLQPGWEMASTPRPPVHRIACLGRIAAEQQTPDGRYNLILRGLSRVRIVDEIPQDKLYRCARAKLVPDRCELPLQRVMELRGRMAEQILPRFGPGAV